MVVRRRGRVLVRKCQPGERWAGLWDFPRTRRTDFQSVQEKLHCLTGLAISLGQPIATLNHGVTRFRITLEVYDAAAIRSVGKPSRRSRPAEVCWATPADLAELPLSSTGRQIAKLLANGRREV